MTNDLLIKSIIGRDVTCEAEYMFAGREADEADLKTINEIYGCKRKWKFDYAFPDYKIALEIEGAVWVQGRHTRGSGFIKDIEKYNTAALLGWYVFRCTPSTTDKVKALELIKRLIKRKRMEGNKYYDWNV